MSEGSDYEDEVGSDEWSGEDDAMEEDAMTEDIDMGAGPIVLRPARAETKKQIQFLKVQ